MAEIKVRGLEDWIVAFFKERARLAGHSLEEQVRLVLHEAALQPRQAAVERSRQIRQKLLEAHGLFDDSTAHIRAERDRWG